MYLSSLGAMALGSNSRKFGLIGYLINFIEIKTLLLKRFVKTFLRKRFISGMSE